MPIYSFSYLRIPAYHHFYGTMLSICRWHRVWRMWFAWMCWRIIHLKRNLYVSVCAWGTHQWSERAREILNEGLSWHPLGNKAIRRDPSISPLQWQNVDGKVKRVITQQNKCNKKMAWHRGSQMLINPEKHLHCLVIFIFVCLLHHYSCTYPQTPSSFHPPMCHLLFMYSRQNHMML